MGVSWLIAVVRPERCSVMKDSVAPPAGAKGQAALRRPFSLCWNDPKPHDCLRDTGIGLVGRIPWGSHVCMFCETKQDVIEAVSTYFAATPGASELCIWVVSDPLSVGEATTALARHLPGFVEHHRAGRFKVIAAEDWYYVNGRFDWERVVAGWHKFIDDAVALGFDGVRACGNPLWRSVDVWRDIADYEHALEATLEQRRIIMLCTYMTGRSLPEDVLDVARSHQAVIARRRGDWQFLEVPGSDHAKREIFLLNGDSVVLPDGLVQDGVLTDRERVVLAQLAKGASSKETARILGISPRTVDFHRGKMMRKLGARNTAELVGKVVGKG